jgi:translation initiation factor IF-3
MSKKEVELKYNRQIKSEEVRLVGDNVNPGVYPLREALSLSYSMGLDLIEISPNVNPPVCKIQDYNKFLYEQKKKQKENEKKSKQNKIETKEIRFTPNTDEHDYEFKKKHILKFIEDGDRVKTFVFFKGREINYKEKGEVLLLKLATELSDKAVAEKLPVLEGNRMIMFLKPKK